MAAYLVDIEPTVVLINNNIFHLDVIVFLKVIQGINMYLSSYAGSNPLRLLQVVFYTFSSAQKRLQPYRVTVLISLVF